MAVSLIFLAGSPWSERTKWAIKRANLPIAIDKIPYTPFNDEPWLRYVLGEWNPTKRVSVPVLRVGSRAIPDSTAIARWLCSQPKSKLTMGDSEEVLQKVLRIAETANSAGRIICMENVVAAGSARADLSAVPRVLKKIVPEFILRATCVFIYSYILWKYRRPEFTSRAATVEALRGALKELRDLRGSRPFFNGSSFSYTDVVAAGAVTAISSPSHPEVSAFQVWEDLISDAETKEQFADLIQWRDTLYREFR